MAVAMNAEYNWIKDHCAPVTSPPPSNVLRPCWVRGPGAIWTKSIPAKTRDPEPGRESEARPVISGRDADSAPTDHAEEPALFCIDDCEFDFEYDDLDFAGMMAALPESVSIASDDGMAHEDETHVPRIQTQVQLAQWMPPLQTGASVMAALVRTVYHGRPRHQQRNSNNDIWYAQQEEFRDDCHRAFRVLLLGQEAAEALEDAEGAF